MNPEAYLIVSGILFIIGLVGLLLRRNILIILLCIEIMLNAANLTLVTASSMHGQVDGHIVAFFVMVIAAVEVTIGLAIAVILFKEKGSIEVGDLNLLKG